MILKFCFVFIFFSSNAHLAKITLYDSTKQREDLNWSKISFKETSNSIESNFEWIQQRLNSKSDLHGWKESSYSSSGGDDVWRIHFVCDLNVQNIQNWLFTPLINTKTANRITLNLTFTIRECENLPVKQVKNCREKFELYFEEKNTNEDNYLTVQPEFKDITEQNRSNLFLLNKIKQLRFRDTFISDTGLRYYNSIVDRQKYKTVSNRLGESSINVELREISLSGQNPNFVRFAIRDTGACISLLSVQITYVTCSTLRKYGIVFPETPTGKDLTDLVQVDGQCPENSVFTQKPQAICTAKGEWLITDSSLATKCQCNPGYEFINDKCIQCPIGYFKSATSNEQKCEPCPSNSWSSAPGMASCTCLKGFYKMDLIHDSNMCQQIPGLSLSDLNFNFVNDDKINITMNRKDKNLPSSSLTTDIKCFQCDSFSINGYAINKCELNCFILDSFENSIMILNRKLNRISRIKLIIKLKLKNTDISEKVFYLNLKQNKHEKTDSKIDCQFHNENNKFCFNMSMNIESEIDKIYPKNDLIEKISQNKLIRWSIFALVLNNDFQLIPSDFNLNYNLQQSNSKSSYIQVPIDFPKNFPKQNWSTEFTFCNTKQIDKVRLQLDIDTSNYKNYQQNHMEIYTIDFQLSQVCSEKPKIVTELITNHAFVRLTESMVIKNEPISSNRSNRMQVVLPTILSLIFIFFVVLLIFFLHKIKNSKNDDGQFNKFINKKCVNKCNSCSNTNTSCSSSTSSSPSTICTTSQIIERESKLYYVDPHTYEDPTLAVQEFAQEISPLDIKIESVIGGGEFGDVCKGKLKLDQNWITVAIKTLKVGSSEKNRCEFLTEASIMAQFSHENIICLEGVVTQSHPFMIITEYMDNGSLDTFLRLNSWRLNIYDLVKMLKDIANGMKYLSAMNFVHRDLAARNILVDKDLKCKVADFGLSREIEGTNTEGVYWTKGGKIPVRWTAPEAITHTKFTCSSDVWSFGVVMWEVMSYGERPYWNWSNTDVIKAVDKGFRLFIPAGCPQILYNMMLDCWEADRLKRPKFKKIANDLDLLIKSRKESLFVPAKNLKTNSNIDTNRPNFTHLTSVQEWLNSLNLIDYVDLFVNRRLLSLSQVLNFELEDLKKMEIYDPNHQMIILDSIKRILFELNFQNGFLV